MDRLSAWTRELETALNRKRERHLFRQLESQPVGVDFSSNDYLSLNADGLLADLLRQLLPISDVGSTGSRLIRGQRLAFEQAEQAMASWIGREATLLFHSGYAANVGGLSCLFGPADEVFLDRLCHATLLDAVRLSGARRLYFRHNDMEHLDALLRGKAVEGQSGGEQGKQRWTGAARGRRWILSETIFSMDGDMPDLQALDELAWRNGALLVLDEAHAIGVLGPHGAGLTAGQMAGRSLAVTSYPMGKAPGLMGAFLAGSAILKDYLINNARGFVFTTAQPPFLADLLRAVTGMMPSAEMEGRRARLRNLSEYTHRRLAEEGFDAGKQPSHIVPVVLGGDERTLRTASHLRERGFSVYAIRPPTVPAGSSRLRISLHAGNTPDEVEALIEQLVISRSIE